MHRMRDRACLITGSTGIGAATARMVVEEGGAVFIVSRTEDHARTLADELGGGWAAADLAKEADAEAAVTAAVERFGRIDGLFAVAGGSGRRFGDGPIHQLTADGWERTLAINLRTQALVCRAVIRNMLAQEPNSSGTGGPSSCWAASRPRIPCRHSSRRMPMPRPVGRRMP